MCGSKKLKEENELAFNLCNKYGITFHNGQGALQLDAIIRILELEDIKEKIDRKWIIQQIISYFQGAFRGLKDGIKD